MRGTAVAERTAERKVVAVIRPYFLWFLLSFAAVVVCGSTVENQKEEVAGAVVFLTRFGYLPDEGPTRNLLSDREFRSAVVEAQSFGGIEPTGLLNAPMLMLMRSRRCGVPDYAARRTGGNPGADRVRRYAIQGQKWPRTHITWSVRNEEGESSNVGPRQQQYRRKVLERAFGVWSDVSALTFQEVIASEERKGADILVSFLSGVHGDGYPFDGAGSVLAHAFFPGEGIGGDAHFDAEEQWLPKQANRKDDNVNLFAVAAHEIGHSLGLSHSAVPGSLMFPYYQLIEDGEQVFRLPTDDAEGIRHLYGAKHPTTEAPPMKADLTPTTFYHFESITTSMRTTTPDLRLKNKKKLFHMTDASTTTTYQPPTIRTTTDDLSEVVDSPSFETPPDMCHSTIDAISLIRREIFVFKGKFFWRFHANRTLHAGYPVSIDRFWYDLPSDIEGIDAPQTQRSFFSRAVISGCFQAIEWNSATPSF